MKTGAADVPLDYGCQFATGGLIAAKKGRAGALFAHPALNTATCISDP
jgi:hypothetical protein